MYENFTDLYQPLLITDYWLQYVTSDSKFQIYFLFCMYMRSAYTVSWNW